VLQSQEAARHYTSRLKLIRSVPTLLGGGSVLLKQDSPYLEHFYAQLQPARHFVPFRADLADLGEQVCRVVACVCVVMYSGGMGAAE
jgi:hypothetical protein